MKTYAAEIAFFCSAFTCLALLYEIPMIWVNILFFTAVTIGLIWLWTLVARKSSKNQPDS